MATKKGQVPADQPAVSQRILDVAVQLAQTRGFNGFSYADIAEKLVVTKASLHYHFPSKADLGRSLIERYRRAFADALATIDRQAPDARERLRRYVGLYDTVLRDDRMCLCGMLAAEYATLPEAMQDELRTVLRRKRGVAGPRPRGGAQGRRTRLSGTGETTRSGDPRRAGGRDARRAHVSRRPALSVRSEAGARGSRRPARDRDGYGVS